MLTACHTHLSSPPPAHSEVYGAFRVFKVKGRALQLLVSAWFLTKFGDQLKWVSAFVDARQTRMPQVLSREKGNYVPYIQ